MALGFLLFIATAKMPSKRKRTPTQKAAEQSSKQRKTSDNSSNLQTTSPTTSSISEADKQQLIAELVPSVTRSVVETLVAMQVLPNGNPPNDAEGAPLDPSAPTASTSTTQDTPSTPRGAQVSEGLPIPQSCTVTDPKGTSLSLGEISSFLLDQALSTSSQQTYKRAYNTYEQFAKTELNGLQVYPASISNLLLFIAYCFRRNLAPSTVSTYISAIGYYHKLKQLPDATTNFLVKKSLQGYHNHKKQVDTRLPITVAILGQLLESLKFTTTSHFIRSLLKAMYLVAFHAFLRVGEMTSSGKNADYLLAIKDVQMVWSDAKKIEGFELKISQYKHSKGATKSLFIKATHSCSCPVKALQEYLLIRRATQGPLFGFMDGSAIPRVFFSQQLRMSLNWAGLDQTRYKGHTFRIGAASAAAQKGVSEDQIKHMGRWTSDAYKKYIRIPMLNL